jgi:hypothetical protein
MRAELKFILPNEVTISWDEYAKKAVADPYDAWSWLSLNIGPEGEKASDIFQVLVSTPRAVQRAAGRGKRFRGLIVPIFDAATIESKLTEIIQNTSGESWIEIAEKLSKVMQWEYEGMNPL